MRLNRQREAVRTHEGARAKAISPEQALRRSVLSCMLWEDTFYEDGQSVAERIADLVDQCDPEFVAELAIGARNDMKLRHVPLWLARSMARLPHHRKYVDTVLAEVIQRPDELCEFLAMYWKDGKEPIANRVKKGLASAFTKFNAYQLAKWDKDAAIRLRDVMFLCHPTPKDDDQAYVWKQLVDGTLPAPDTWEVGLSAKNEPKKDTWTRLLENRNLGGLALLRNLRGMTEAGVSENLIRDSLHDMSVERILPFRFIAAARYAPHLEDSLEHAMFKCLKSQPMIPGLSVVLLDVSGSMGNKISKKSDLLRIDAACGLAMLMREICEEVVFLTFSARLERIAPRRGFALRDAIVGSQPHSSTYLGASVRAVYSREKVRVKGTYRGHVNFAGQNLSPDRLIALTDEQSHDPVPDPSGVGYMVNVACEKNGVGYGPWTHLDGWSEAVIAWIREYEECGY